MDIDFTGEDENHLLNLYFTLLVEMHAEEKRNHTVLLKFILFGSEKNVTTICAMVTD